MPLRGTDFKLGVMSTSSPLQEKSKAFALEIIRVCNFIKANKKESVLTNQLIRSGTSIGANIREAFYAHGRADFIAKLQIALKECSESEYWLELLIESGYYHESEILERCIELKKLLIASLNTAKECFAAWFPQVHFKAFLCYSWLLYPPMLNSLPPASNIRRFGDRFTILGTCCDAEQAMENIQPDAQTLLTRLAKENKALFGFGCGVIYL